MNIDKEINWREFYSRCWNVLIKHAGVNNSMKNHFIYCMLIEEHPTNEYRFGGVFGMGGKFWRHNSKIYINYYHEDRSSKLDKVQSLINNYLLEIQDEFLGSNVGLFGPPIRHNKEIEFNKRNDFPLERS